MGIDKLKKNLIYAECAELVDIYSYDFKDVYIDFSKLFYIFVCDSETFNIDDLILKTNDYLIKYKKYNITLFIDKGKIPLKKNIREQRTKYYVAQFKRNYKEYNLSENIEAINNVFNENITIDENDNEKKKNPHLVFQYSALSDKNNIIDLVLDNIKYNKIFCNNIDAEYLLVHHALEYSKTNNILPLIDSNDQDIIYLLLHNQHKDFFVNNYCYKNNILSKNISLLTFILNKSDYNPGINKLSLVITPQNKDRYVLEFKKKYNTYIDLIRKYINMRNIRIKNHIEKDIEQNIKLFKNLIHLINDYTYIDNECSFFTNNYNTVDKLNIDEFTYIIENMNNLSL